MPRPVSVTGADGLPLWDTFEASFFLIAGLFIGIVLGVLFPSLWRTLRRRFRNTNRFAPESAVLSGPLESPVKLFVDDDDALSSEEGEQQNATVSQAFVLARGKVQQGEEREAIRLYLDILGFEQVSKKQTNRALFELSQVYVSLGLENKAFDTAYELLYRKPENTMVLEHLLKLCMRTSLLTRARDVVGTYRGNPTAQTRMLISHALCAAGEGVQDDREATIDFARDALRWNALSARSKVLLWKITSTELWERGGNRALTLWMALAADLETRAQIDRDTGISAAAGGTYLAQLLMHLANAHDAQNRPRQVFARVQSEFYKLYGRAKLSAIERERMEWIVVFAAMRFLNDVSFWQNDFLKEIVEILAPDLWARILGHDVSSSLRTRGLASGLALHSCPSCKTLVAEFEWMCQVCGAMESFLPHLR